MLFSNDFLVKHFQWVMMAEMFITVPLLALGIYLISLLLNKLKRERVAGWLMIASVATLSVGGFLAFFSPVWKTTLPLSENPVGTVNTILRLKLGEQERVVAITSHVADAVLNNFYGRVFTNVVIYDPAKDSRKILRYQDYQGKLVQVDKQYGLLKGRNCAYKVIDLWNGQLVSDECELTKGVGGYRRDDMSNGILYIETKKGEKLTFDLKMNQPINDIQADYLDGKYQCRTISIHNSKNRGDMKRFANLLRPVFLYDYNKQRNYKKRRMENACRLPTTEGQLRLAYHQDTAFGKGAELFSVINQEDEILWTIPITEKRSRLKELYARVKGGDIEIVLRYASSLDVILLDKSTGKVKSVKSVI